MTMCYGMNVSNKPKEHCHQICSSLQLWGLFSIFQLIVFAHLMAFNHDGLTLLSFPDTAGHCFHWKSLDKPPIHYLPGSKWQQN